MEADIIKSDITFLIFYIYFKKLLIGGIRCVPAAAFLSGLSEL